MAEKEKIVEADKAAKTDKAADAVKATEPEVPEVREIKETKYDDSVDISPAGAGMSTPEVAAETATTPEAAAHEAKKVGAGGEITASTLVHLLGIPNKSEFKILERKMDLVLNRLNSLSTKIDAVVTDLSSGSMASALARIDEQLLAVQQKIDSKK